MESFKKQQFGLKFPFTCDAIENYFLDTNMSYRDKVKSLVSHIVFTPQGQKLRDPNFGTSLIKYIFEINDESSWESVKNEIKYTLESNIENFTLNDIEIMQSEEDGHLILVKISYSVQRGFQGFNDSMILSL